MTPEEADKSQDWRGMDGATAWHLIDRHADDWSDVGELMNAWLRANARADCGKCANKGRINGLSQETFCENCRWQGCKEDYFSRPNAELRGRTLADGPA